MGIQTAGERMSIASLLRERRKELKLSRREVAERVGMSEHHYWKLEVGRIVDPGLRTCVRLCFALMLNIRDFSEQVVDEVLEE